MAATPKWLKRFGLGVLLLVVVGIVYQKLGERHDAKAFSMPGQLVDVGHHRLHIWCTGQGSPTILMLAGSGTPSVSSYALQAELTKTSRVCSYDRAGLGWSDLPKHPMDLPQTVADLQTLLQRSGEKEPFVLVPESFGGLVALMLATRAPAQVAGIVAVDSSEPESWHRLSGSMVASSKMRDYLWQVGWRVGVIRLLLDSQAPSWVSNMSPKIRGQFAAVWSRPMPNYANEWIDAYQQTALADFPKSTAGLLGNKPLIVISHGRRSDFLNEEFEQSWPQAQEILTKLSTHSEHIIARDNGHPIAQENPRLVADAVAKMVAELRR